jgi:hypothetical protein
MSAIVMIRPVDPGTDTDALLPGAQFVDAYRMPLKDDGVDARLAAERMFGQSPRWINSLMTLRNYLMAPFGLKTPDRAKHAGIAAIGVFPIISETSRRLVAGFNDTHLDFRVIVDVGTMDGGRCVTAITRVLTHNALGRIYLAVILPFHRLIVPSMLRQVHKGPRDQPAAGIPRR